LNLLEREARPEKIAVEAEGMAPMLRREQRRLGHALSFGFVT
jgi:hypothetical protein